MVLSAFRTLNMFLMTKSGRKHKFATVQRYLRVKAWKYLKAKRNFDWPSGGNIFMLYSPGGCVSEKCYVLGFYDYDGMHFIKSFCGQGDIFYDVAANVGPYSLLAHYCGAQVFAFEGSPSTIERLRMNFVINGIRESQIIHSAVSNFTGFVDFLNIEGSSVNRIWKSVNSAKVPAIRIDDFVRSHCSPTFVKIDTEGHELQVILGMRETLKCGIIKYLSFEANGILSETDLDIILRMLTYCDYTVGLIDFDNRVFRSQKKLGHRSPTGDYQVLSRSMCEHIKKKGFQCL